MTTKATVASSPKPEVRFIATNAAFPGYWGSHKDGPHHAIVECLGEGASTGDVFVVYEAYKGCGFDGMGSMYWLVEHGEPKVEGVYDATGSWLGSSLLEVCKDASENDWWVPEHEHLISKATIAGLKRHYEQNKE